MNVSLHPRVLLLFVVGLVWIISTRHDTPTLPQIIDGHRMPFIQLTDVSENVVSTNDSLGTPVVYTLWTTWCPACSANMPVLNQLVPEMEARGIRMVAVNQGETLMQIQSHLLHSSIELDIWQDPQRQMGMLLQANDLPSTIFVDANGVIRLLYRGPITPTLFRTMATVLTQEEYR